MLIPIPEAFPRDGAGYIWQDGSTSPTFTVTASGTYHVQWTHPERTWEPDTIVVGMVDLPSLQLGPDQELCEGGSLLLGTGSMPLAGGVWSDGNSEWPRAVALPGLYSFAFAADGCSVSDSIVVTIVDRSYGVELPSVFTPNSDGSNNLFRPITLQGVSSLSFRVYDRWGQEVFHTTQLEAGWVVGHHPASRFRRVPTSGPLRPQPSEVTSLAISSTAR